MRYRILGNLEVSADDATPVPIAAPKRRQLLLALLLAPGRIVPIDDLCDAMWDGNPPPAASESLHAHVSRLRREIGADRIVTDLEGYRLRLDDHDELDAVTAASAVAIGRLAAEEGRWRDSAAAFRRASELWRGPSLADLSGRAFARPEIARLDELHDLAIEGRIEAELALGGHLGVISDLERLVARSPYRERLWEFLMLALYRAGRQADALGAYRRLRTLLGTELGVDPSPAVAALQRRILQQDPTLMIRSIDQSRVRLPAEIDPLLGRDELVGDAVALLRSHRLVTLTGPGGVGKTRLSISIANAVLPEYPDGVAFVDLSAVREPDGVLQRIGERLDAGDRPAEVIGGRRILLVLDNFEQVLGASADVGALLDACDNLAVLVTSRSRLRLRRECRLEVPPLEMAAAGRLLMDRASAVMASGRLDAAVIDEIVIHLDRLPLAIELAAANMAVLAPMAIRDRLGQSLGLLTRGPRDAPTRHRTLHQTIAWSDELLSPEARAAFRTLSVFPGAFGLDAALAVSGAGVDVIGELVDHSMISVTDGRYRMLETIRQFARSDAEKSGVALAARDRHLEHFRSLPAEAQLVDGIPGGRPKAWYELCGRERENFRLAFDQAVERHDDGAVIELFRDMGMYWLIVGSIEVGWRWAQIALHAGRNLDPGVRMIVVMIAGEFPKYSGEFATALELKHQGLSLARAAGHHLGITSALADIGWIHAALDQDELAAAFVAEATVLHGGADCDPVDQILTLGAAAEVSLRAGRYDETARFLDELDELEERTQSPRDWASGCAASRGTVLHARGDRASAAEMFRRAIRSGAEFEYRWPVASALDGLAAIAVDEKSFEAGARLVGMADRLRAEAGAVPWLLAQRAGTVTALREGLGDQSFAAARAGGHALSLAEIADAVAAGSGTS